MKNLIVMILVMTGFLSGCESGQTTERRKIEHLATLTCHSNKANRSKQELQAIADACFKAGSFSKSSGKKW